MERPSRFGEGYENNPETPWDMGDNDRNGKVEVVVSAPCVMGDDKDNDDNPFSYSSAEFRLQQKSSESNFMRTGVRPPVAFEVDVTRGAKGKAEKKAGGGFFGNAGKSRAVEARFLGKREGEWKKMREVRRRMGER